MDYQTIAVADIPGSDLRVYQVAGTLPVYAELYRGTITVGTAVSVVGMGVHTLGAEVTTADPEPNEHGWRWGGTRGKSWGSNHVEGFATTSEGFKLVVIDFDAVAGEAALAVNDSGGGLFIFDGGQWKLAGVHYAVEGRYSTSADGSSPFNAAIYDGEGLFIESSNGWVAAPDRPQFSYVSNVSHYASAIDAAVASIPEPATLSLLAAAGSLALLRRR